MRNLAQSCTTTVDDRTPRGQSRSIVLLKPRPPLVCGVDFIHAPLQLEVRNGVVVFERCLRCGKVRRPKE